MLNQQEWYWGTGTEGYLSDWNWVSREQRRIIRTTSTGAEEYCSVLIEQVMGI